MDWSFLLLIALFLVGCLVMAGVMMRMTGNRMGVRKHNNDPGVEQNLRHRDHTVNPDDDVSPRE